MTLLISLLSLINEDFEKFTDNIELTLNNLTESNSNLISIFKKNILKFIGPTAHNIFGYHNLKGIKYLTRLRLGLSHLYEHRFKDSFQDTFNPLCNCSCHVENTCHFFLHCPNFLTERNTLYNKITNIDSNILNQANQDTSICNSKYFNEIPFSTKALLILLMSAFFCKKPAFFGKNSIFTQSNSVRAVLDIF